MLIAAALGLAVVVVAAVAVVAFLAGRESAHTRSDASAPLTAIASPRPAPSTTTTGARADPGPAVQGAVPWPAPATVASAPSLEQAAREPAAPIVPGASASVQPSDPAAEPVARYLSEVESIEAQARYWDDPQALAGALVEQAARGEATGFERLIETNRAALSRLKGLGVPDACREHHRATLALMDEAIGFLGRIKGRIGGEAGSLEEFARLGQDLERRGREVDALAAELKRRYRIP